MNDPSVREFSGSFAQVRPRRRGRPVDLHGGMAWTPSNDVGKHGGLTCQQLYEDLMIHGGEVALLESQVFWCQFWNGSSSIKCDDLEASLMDEHVALQDALDEARKVCPAALLGSLGY